MIKKLQKKFIFIAMSVIMIVTIFIFGIIIIGSYVSLNKELDEIINLITDNKGEFPSYKKDSYSRYEFVYEETPFSTRYFSITLDEDNVIENINLDNIAAVSETDAQEMVKDVISYKKTSGFYENYKYKVIDISTGKLIVFLDCTRQLNNFKFLFRLSFIIIAGSFIIIFIILYFYSNHAIKPFIKNMEQQKQFITNASHELKTPLAVIMADVDVLEDELESDNEWLESIKNQSERLNKLIKNMLSLSNMDEKYQELNIVKFNVNDVISDELNSFKSVLNGKTVKFDNKKSVLMRADKDLIRQLVDIFIDNASKYTSENGKININVCKDGKCVKIEISNTCNNINDIDEKRLFDRFYRNDKSHNNKISGYGIGLSIAKSIVDLHNGKISVYKTKDDMICFRVII